MTDERPLIGHEVVGEAIYMFEDSSAVELEVEKTAAGILFSYSLRRALSPIIGVRGISAVTLQPFGGRFNRLAFKFHMAMSKHKDEPMIKISLSGPELDDFEKDIQSQKELSGHPIVRGAELVLARVRADYEESRMNANSGGEEATG